MNTFFQNCGVLIATQTRTEGVFPQRTFIQEFHYTNGIATYNGREWTFSLLH